VAFRQVVAFWVVGVRELLWIRPHVALEVAHWERCARAIPDAMLRRDALDALSAKRLNIEGAALFAVLPPRRNLRLLRLLVAFQVLLDFLDSVSERPAADPVADGRLLHLALRDALDPQAGTRDYYANHPHSADGGYLHALVQACREHAVALPSFPVIRPLAILGAERCGVQGFNHDTDAGRRDRTLQQWAASTFRCDWGMSWWELTAAASSTLGIHALLALAADPATGERDAIEVDGAYMPWVCAASTMLDSYVDTVQDAAEGSHSYIGHYPSAAVAVERTYELVRRALYEARVLPGGARHALIAAGMVAMYLSCDEARTAAKRNTTRRLIAAGGALTRILLPILRAWRVAYQLRPA
jgi:tetraprenyl-beta-curcumene synthase